MRTVVVAIGGAVVFKVLVFCRRGYVVAVDVCVCASAVASVVAIVVALALVFARARASAIAFCALLRDGVGIGDCAFAIVGVCRDAKSAWFASSHFPMTKTGVWEFCLREPCL